MDIDRGGACPHELLPGVSEMTQWYLERRAEKLRQSGICPDEVDILSSYISKKGKVGYWEHHVWNRLKYHLEFASGVRFKWKDLRPTFAQMLKDSGVLIEVISKCLRHTSTRTTELYYARIRSETAFSVARRAWEAPAAKFQDR